MDLALSVGFVADSLDVLVNNLDLNQLPCRTGLRRPRCDLFRPEGGVVELKNGQTLYLAGGAVVEAAVHCQDGENLCIRGRSILCGNSWGWWKGPGHMLRLENCKNVSFQNVRILEEVLDDQSLRVVLGCQITRPANDGIVFAP